MKPPFGYSAWLVDLDGTLYRSIGVRLAMATELLVCGTRAIRTVRAFRRQHERLRLAKPASGECPYAAQIAATAHELNSAEEAVDATVDEWMFRRPAKWLRLFRRRELLRAIMEFRTRGGKTALVSDYPAQYKLRALRAEDLFDVVIANGEADGPERLKPDPQAFVSAAHRLGLTASECLVVGDRPRLDGEAARRAGMSFCHVHQFRCTGRRAKSVALVPR